MTRKPTTPAPQRRVLLVLLGVLVALVAGCGQGPGADGDESNADQDGGADQQAADHDGPVAAQDDLPQRRIELVAVDGRSVGVRVDVAHTPEQRRTGLMGVEELPAGSGMLFVFPEARPRSFWMKDTLIPLDIAYVGEDRRIVRILRMEPCEEDPCPGYPSDAPAQYALEVPAGWFEEVGVAVGWRVDWDDELPDAR